MGPWLRGGSSAWPRMPAVPPLATRLPIGSLGSGPEPLLPRLRDRWNALLILCAAHTLSSIAAPGWTPSMCLQADLSHEHPADPAVS